MAGLSLHGARLVQRCGPGQCILFHSPLDRTVGIANAERLFLAAKHPKSFVSLDKADHLLSDERDARHAGEVLAAWALRYLKPS